MLIPSKEIVPTAWYNFLADYPNFLEQDIINSVSKDLLVSRNVNVAPKQPLALMKQSVNVRDPEIIIPEELRDLYLAYRPTPLRRAKYFEQAIGTNAHIYYKFEGANISGSHKLNTALAQAYYYKKANVKHLITGTGAGQWGAAIAYACKVFGLKCTVFMVGISLRQKPQRRLMMEQFGAQVYESPTNFTAVGRKACERDPERIGSLATATGEAIELANNEEGARFAVGSGENCVLLHQTIIGQEAIAQMDMMQVFPDYVIACMGAGSNFGGIGLPFFKEAQKRQLKCKLVAVEPVACPKLTQGKYLYDINDYSGTTPISKMYTLGNKYIAPSIHAGGLRYHGTSEFLSAMYANGLFEAQAITQTTALAAGSLFAETEGILPAPESAHAIAAAIQIAKDYSEHDAPIRLLINISGHGLFDLLAYEEFRQGKSNDGFPDPQKIQDSLAELTNFNGRLKINVEAT